MVPAAVTAFAVTAILTPALAAWARRRDLLDRPNHRSSHVVATPRLGGIALVLGFVAGIGVLRVAGSPIGPDSLVVVAGALAIALLGLADDVRHVDALVRLGAHVGVALMVVLASGVAEYAWGGWIAVAICVFWIVALTNAYNFMDGIDGIAGAQAVVAGAGWVAVGSLDSHAEVTGIGLLLAAAGAGFLLYNWPPARVFMGDAGSGFFGFLFAALPLAAAPTDGSPRVVLWATAALVVWPFLADTGFTLLRRAVRRENILAAHRSHIYQRLVITGLSHRRVTLLYAALAALGVAAAVAMAAGRSTLVPLLLAATAAGAVATWRITVVRERRASLTPSGAH